MSSEKAFIYRTVGITLAAIVLVILLVVIEVYYPYQTKAEAFLLMGFVCAMAILGSLVGLARYRQQVMEEIANELYQRNVENNRLYEQIKEYSQKLEHRVEERTRQLRESEARYRTLVESAGDVIYTFDIHGNCLSLNRAAAKLLSENPEGFVGNKVASFFPREGLEQCLNDCKRLFEKGEDIVGENPCRFQDTTRWFSTRWTPVKNDKGKVLYGIGISREITEKKKMEQALIQTERLAATGKLAAQIAHELNNPLQGILYALTFILEDPGLHVQNREIVQIAIRETNRIADLIRNMLNFHRSMDSGIESTHINELLQEVLLFFKRPLQDKQTTIVLKLDNELPRLQVNKNQMKQVFLNIISNAQDAMTQGGRLEICTRRDQENVYIDFTDTGCGIPEENLSRIFDMFFSTKGIKGVGIGLSICYGIVQQHGGDLQVKSQVGVGSTFTVRLPIRPVSSMNEG